jgi:hypothetical protein
MERKQATPLNSSESGKNGIQAARTQRKAKTNTVFIRLMQINLTHNGENNKTAAYQT